jgi:hypothetical protein
MSKQALRLTGATNLIARDKPQQSSLGGVRPEDMAPVTDLSPAGAPPAPPISSVSVAPPTISSASDKMVDKVDKKVQMTSVRLDEDLYIRLCDAGRPRPGQPKRKQNEIMVEALEEWLSKRGL